jgi:predicted ribosome-associated RNA-binding protein Tma20
MLACFSPSTNAQLKKAKRAKKNVIVDEGAGERLLFECRKG